MDIFVGCVDAVAVKQSRGALIGVNDMHIAGHARSRGLTLVTSDLADFERVDGLRGKDWNSMAGRG